MGLYRANRDDIQRIADAYYREFRNQAGPSPVVKGPFEFDELKAEESASKPGCYLIYDRGGELRYIGMSEVSMLDRVKKHFSKPVRECGYWINNPPHSIQLIEVSTSWEAPAIEAYLIYHAKGEN